jgi:hypothetical protein
MSDQTLEYYTVISDKPHTLDDNVNAKLAQGWQLQGGVSVGGIITPFGTKESPDIWWMYAQAMVRPKQEKT